MWNYTTQVVNLRQERCEESRSVVLADPEDLLILCADGDDLSVALGAV